MFYFVKLFPPGWFRLGAALPVFVTYVYLPWVYDPVTHCIGTALLFCVYTWLANFKLLTYCWGSGPLSEASIRRSFLKFHLSLTAPVNILLQNERRNPIGRKKRISVGSKFLASDSWPALAAGCVVKAVIVFYTCSFYSHKKTYSIYFLHFLHAIELYVFASMVEEIFGAVAQFLTGFELQPHFDKPYLSSSLEEFWAHRWNLTVSATLKDTIYIPTLHFVWRCTTFTLFQPMQVKLTKPSMWARFVALMATFLVSGLMHELAIYYLVFKVTGEMTAFFLLHGFLTGIEIWLKKQFSPLVQLPWILSVGLTVGFVYYSGIFLFFAPIVSQGIEQRAIEQICTPFMDGF